MKYTQNFHGRIKTAGIDSSESITAPDFIGALAGNADTATAFPATLIPNGTDIDTYIGSEYWGRCFYAGGSNTVTGVPEGREGNAFNLEVVRGGVQRTIQVYRDASIEYVRSADGATWQEWTQLAQINGYYPEMGVGAAGQLSTHLVGNYRAGRHYGKWAHIEAGDNFRASAVFLVNGSNNPSEEGSGLLEVEFVNRATGVEEVAVNVLSGDLMPELFLAVPTADGVDVYVYIREYRTSYISLVSLTPHSTITWMNEDTGSTEPAGAVYATRTNNASGAEYLSRFAYLFAGTSQTGWWKLGSIKGEGMGVNQNRSCVFLVNGILSNQGFATAGETGFLEFDVRRESTITDAKLSVLGGNLNAEEFCVVLSQTEATVYIKLPSQFNAFAVTMLSEDSASASKATPLFEFDTQFIGTSAPSGAQFAVVRNVASRAEADAEGNVINETYATLDELTTAEETLQKGLTAEATARAAAIEDIVDGTTVVGKATNADSATNATHATTAAMANTLADSGHKTLLWSGTLSNGESLDKSLFDEYSVLLFKDNTGAYWIAEFGDFINSNSFGQIKTTMVTSARITMTLCGLASAGSSEYSLTFAKYEYSISNGSITGSPEVLDRWLTNIWGLEAFRRENG